MKKLMVLVVISAVMGVCVPSYGDEYTLVYKLSIGYKGVDWGNVEMAKGKIQGFLVVRINDDVDPNEVVDTGLVIYSKTNKKYTRIDDFWIDLDLWILENQIFGFTVGIVTLETYSFKIIMSNKLKATDIGLSDKKELPSAMSGGILLDGGVFGKAIKGSGSVSAKLDSKMTKTYRIIAVDSVVDVIVSDLEDDGYAL